MLSKVNSISLMGVEGFIVNIEVDIQQGLPCFNMVGLPDTVVKESKDRVRTAIKNTGFEFPIDKITVNFAPADIKKEGTHMDLAVAVGILTSSNIIVHADLRDSVFIGELSLNGEIRGVRGILPMVLEASKKNYKRIFIPYENLNEIKYIRGIEAYPVSTLGQLVDYFNDGIAIEKYNILDDKTEIIYDSDYSEVKGQTMAKRAVEIAAAGRHNLLMVGSPGAGKTMIAQRIPTILPELSYEEAIDVTRIYSIMGANENKNKIINIPPFRSPHHSASTMSIVGGGSNPMPGEVSLAHRGVLFLDELPEFRRDTLEALRQPIEDGKVCITRVKGKYTYPANFMLVASMNPCPCGYYGSEIKECRCTPMQIKNYLNRVSGPLLDRIDICIQVEPIQFNEINSTASEESSLEIRKRVIDARRIQRERLKEDRLLYNSEMKPKHIRKYCELNSSALKLFKKAFDTMSLSTRAYNKILKVARTIADLDKSKEIQEEHVAEAIQYRILDRKYW